MKFKVLKYISAKMPEGYPRKIFDFTSYYFKELFKSFENEHLFLSAAGIAFSLMISIIPFLLIGFAVLGTFTTSESLMLQVNEVIKTAIPYPEVANYVYSFFEVRIPDVYKYNSIAAHLGGLALLFTSTWLFSSLRTALNHIFEVEKKKSAWYGLFKDLLLIVSLIFVMLLSTTILPAIRIAIDSTLNFELLQELHISDFIRFLVSLSSFLIIFLLFLIIYNVVPYERVGKRVTALSAFWAAFLWAGMKIIFGYYVSNFLSERNLYGAFLILMLILFWIFYSSILFLVGAKIGMLYKKRRTMLEEQNYAN